MPAEHDVVKSHFDWAIVTASCLASLCGTYLAVELLNRRGTGVRSTRSWFETITCAICLGLIGIWCMHFIGNRAIILGDGSDNLQLVYNPGVSVASAVLPVALLILAFALQERQYSTRMNRAIALLVTGLASGLSVVGMHYVGNLGISNYTLHYSPGFMAGSFIIAVADCLLVMGLFFTWRDKWISKWPRRLMCAALLSIGISAMHFLASTHCVYHFKHYSEADAVRSRNIQVIVAGVFCGVAAFVIGGFLLTSRLRDRHSKKRSKKVILNCAMFHPDGRLLVTTDGMLPAHVITDRYHQHRLTEDFDTNHLAFHWIFRVSRNWPCVSDFIPKMKSHLNALCPNGTHDTRPNAASSGNQFDSDTYRDYSVIFRERFCVAASNLAATMGLPVTHIGVLFDRMIDIGVLGYLGNGRWDVETGPTPTLYGNGKLLFLTRQLLDDETHKLINLGFKFATIEQVGRNIAATMQIPFLTLEDHVADLRRFIDVSFAEVKKKTGTCIGFFAMVSNLHNFDLAVMKTHRDQIPAMQILEGEPDAWQARILNNMHNKRFPACYDFLRSIYLNNNSEYTDLQVDFVNSVLTAITTVAAYVPLLWVEKAVFYGQPMPAHFSEVLGIHAPTTKLYSFLTLPEVNASFEDCDDITLVPLKFYRARQNCYYGSRNHLILAYEVNEEFAKILNQKTDDDEGAGKKSWIGKKLSGYLQKLNIINKKAVSRPTSAVLPISEDNSDDSFEISELVDPMEMIMQSSRVVQPTVYGPQEPQSTGDTILMDRTVTQNRANMSQSSMEIRPVANNVVNRGFVDPTNPVYDGNTGRTTAVVASVGKPVTETSFVDELITFARAITTRWNISWN